VFRLKGPFLHHVNGSMYTEFWNFSFATNCRSLTDNSFSGSIPASIGHLSKLYWLDLAENQLDGPIPVSNGNTPGLDMLLLAKHLYVKSL
jgi:hypothetical protein